MRSSTLVSDFTAKERRLVALTTSAELSPELSLGGLAGFSPEGGPDPLVGALWDFSGIVCVLVLMLDWRALRWVVNAVAADSASCLACRNCFILLCSSAHRR